MTTPAEEIVNASRRGMENVRFLQGSRSVSERSKLADMMVFYRNLNSIARKAAILEMELGIGIQTKAEPESETDFDEPKVRVRRFHPLNPPADAGESGTSAPRITGEPSTSSQGSPNSSIFNFSGLFRDNARQQEKRESQNRHPSVWDGTDDSDE